MVVASRKWVPSILLTAAAFAVAWVVSFALVATQVMRPEGMGAGAQGPAASIIVRWLAHTFIQPGLAPLVSSLIWGLGIVHVARATFDRTRFLRAVTVSVLASGLGFVVLAAVSGRGVDGKGGWLLAVALLGVLWGAGDGHEPLFERHKRELLIAFVLSLSIQSALAKGRVSAAFEPLLLVDFLTAGGPVLLIALTGAGAMPVAITRLVYSSLKWALMASSTARLFGPQAGRHALGLLAAEATALTIGLAYGLLDRGIRSPDSPHFGERP
jgi:hypothetical protein